MYELFLFFPKVLMLFLKTPKMRLSSSPGFIHEGWLRPVDGKGVIHVFEIIVKYITRSHV